MIEKTLSRPIFLVALGVLLLQTSVWSQSSNISSSCNDDYRVDFVRFGKFPPEYKDETDERVWLKFTNSSRKKVLKIEATDHQQTFDFLLKKSNELSIYYDVLEKVECGDQDRSIPERPFGYTRREVYVSIELRPKESFIFSVAKQHFKSGRAVAIDYSCARNCGTSNGRQHRAYYFEDVLPQRPQELRPSEQKP